MIIDSIFHEQRLMDGRVTWKPSSSISVMLLSEFCGWMQDFEWPSWSDNIVGFVPLMNKTMPSVHHQPSSMWKVSRYHISITQQVCPKTSYIHATRDQNASLTTSCNRMPHVITSCSRVSKLCHQNVPCRPHVLLSPPWIILNQLPCVCVGFM